MFPAMERNIISSWKVQMLLLEKNDFKMNRDTVNSRMEMKIKSQYVSFINTIKDLKPFF